MNLPTIHDRPLIAISVVIAFLSSYAALDLLGRLKPGDGGGKRGWIAGSAIALGSGYWAMHVVSMLAYYPADDRISYDARLVAASLAFAVATSWAGLGIVARNGLSRVSATFAGLCIGLGIVNTQVLGFMAVDLSYPVGLSAGFVAMSVTLSVGVGLVVAILAFSGGSPSRNVAAAFCMTLAVAGEHYVTLIDVSFAPGNVRTATESTHPNVLGLLVAFALCGLLGLAFCASHYDRNASDALEREAEALRRSEGRFRLLVDGLKDHALLMLDAAGAISQWNDGAARLTGYEEAEAAGMPWEVLFTEADRMAGVPAATLSAASADGAASLSGDLRRKGGATRPSAQTLQAVALPDGTAAGYAVLVRDVTVERKAEARLRETRAALVQSQKMEAIGQLTGGIAHDFNNLLTVVLGHLEFADKAVATGDGPRLARSVAGARGGAERARTLTGRLMSFARKQALDPVTLSANGTVGNMVQLIRRTLSGRIEVETVLDPGLWHCHVDAGQLEGAVLNLVINARDAIPGRGRISLATGNVEAADVPGAEPAGPGYVRVSVRDDGVGMDATTLSRVFEPFFTTKPSGQGTGLGLAMVYGFVQQSGGIVTIGSTPGAGTEVAMHFPRRVAPAEPAPLAADLPPPARGAGERVLVVEDEPEVRSLCAETLRSFGYEVDEAADADGARAAIAATRYDVLLVDLGLPGEDGLAVALAARGACPDADIVLTTGYGDAIDPEVEDAVEASDCILKPFTPEQLARTVGGVVMSRRVMALDAA